MSWEKIHERNEPLDCRAYSRAAAHIKGIDRWSAEQWQQLRESLGVQRKDKAEAPAKNGVKFRRSNFWDK
jgi:phage terminase large subunit GpA-like protein